MMDIFSSFDPATNSIFQMSPSLFWLMNVMTLLLIHPLFWSNPNQIFWLLSFPINMMEEQSNRTSTTHLKGLTTILTALFVLIISINFMGIAPYVFSASSHLFFTLVLGLPMWLSLIISSLKFSVPTTLASLLPSGAPAWLNPFLIIIETTSTLVRPITLSFRLAANMSAGHIVLTLISIYLMYSSISLSLSFLLLLFIQVGYTIFEMGICLIQAYIFCLLLSLYTEDHADPHSASLPFLNK